jgi:hypothetical protein
MEDLIQYIKNKNYNVIDITNSVNVLTYALHTKKLMNEPNTVAYFLRNKQTDHLFKILEMSDQTNLFFINKDNVFYVTFTGKFIKYIKLSINKFLEGDSECNICYDTDSYSIMCMTCSFRICNSCVSKLVEQNKTNCPQCGKYLAEEK